MFPNLSEKKPNEKRPENNDSRTKKNYFIRFLFSRINTRHTHNIFEEHKFTKSKIQNWLNVKLIRYKISLPKKHGFNLVLNFFSHEKETWRKKTRKSTLSKFDDFEGYFGFYISKWKPASTGVFRESHQFWLKLAKIKTPPTWEFSGKAL